MNISIKTSKRKVKYHDQFWVGHETYIPKNTPYIQIHNNGIGSNGRYKNYPLEYVQAMILKARTHHININMAEIEMPTTVQYEMKDAELYSNLFTADDIPF